jgi:glycosyl transferase, family 25
MMDRMPPIYLINLARRPDRLAAMEKEFDRVDLKFVRIDAIDAQSSDPDWLDASFAEPGPMGSISLGAKACTLSHFKAYELFLSSTDAALESHAIILEDDILLTEKAAALLSDLDWLPASTKLLKLECWGSLPILMGRPTQVGGSSGPLIAPLFSQHLGCAGYIISRSAAAAVLDMDPKPNLAIDQLLFDPVRSAIFAWLEPEQLVPALFKQASRMESDIRFTPSSTKAGGQSAMAKEACRLFHQARWLPTMMAALVMKSARYATPASIQPSPP